MKRSSPHRPRAARPALLAAAALAGAGFVSACAPLIKGKDEPQDVLNTRVVGMQAGDFFQRYGRPSSRNEELDGSTTFNWQSSIGTTPPGEMGLDERICRLRITADKRGKIEIAQIVFDNVGRQSTSRCKEMFRAG